MNMFRKYAAISFIGIGVMLVQSCGGSEDEVRDVTEAESVASVSYVVDENGSGRVFTKPFYKVEFDNTYKTAMVKMENVDWDPTTPAASYLLADIAWKFNSDNDARVINCVKAVPAGAVTPVLSDVQITLFAPLEDSQTLGALLVKYTADSRFKVTDIPLHTLFAGTTETINTETDASFTSTKTTYEVIIDYEKMIADVKVNGALFAQNMPPMNMVFPGIAVEMKDGGFVLKSERLIPTINGDPFPRFAITKFSMDVELQKESRLYFECMGMNQVSPNNVSAFFEAVYLPSESGDTSANS